MQYIKGVKNMCVYLFAMPKSPGSCQVPLLLSDVNVSINTKHGIAFHSGDDVNLACWYGKPYLHRKGDLPMSEFKTMVTKAVHAWKTLKNGEEILVIYLSNDQNITMELEGGPATRLRARS